MRVPLKPSCSGKLQTTTSLLNLFNLISWEMVAYPKHSKSLAPIHFSKRFVGLGHTWGSLRGGTNMMVLLEPSSLNFKNLGTTNMTLLYRAQSQVCSQVYFHSPKSVPKFTFTCFQLCDFGFGGATNMMVWAKPSSSGGSQLWILGPIKLPTIPDSAVSQVPQVILFSGRKTIQSCHWVSQHFRESQRFGALPFVTLRSNLKPGIGTQTKSFTRLGFNFGI